jgi:hypothetical protein
MALFDKVWDAGSNLAKRLKGIFAPIALFLFKRHPGIFSGVCLLFLASAAFAWQYLARSHRYEQIVTETMETKLENTPQTYKALEAFILSGGAGNIQEKLLNAKISDYFWKQLVNIDSSLRAPTSTDATAIKLEISVPDTANPPARVDDAIVTDTATQGFLFLPLGRNTRTLTDSDLQQIVKCQLHDSQCISFRDIDSELSKNAVLMDDVSVSRKQLVPMAAILANESFDGDIGLKDILKPTSDQAYYLTASGLNRIVSSAETTNGNTGQHIYASQFKASTFFPSRPYYLGATEGGDGPSNALTPLSVATSRPSSETRPTVGKLFYVSKPYFDIGGNGVVVTLALPLHYPKHSDGVICFDFALLPNAMLGRALIDRVHLLDGKVAVLTCTVEGAATCSVKGDSNFEEDFKTELEDKISKSVTLNSISQIGGDISVLQTSGSVKEPDDFFNPKEDARYIFEVLGGKQKSFWFSVPSTPMKIIDGKRSVTFVGSSLNLNRFVMKTAAYGFLALMCLFAGLLLIVWSWHDDAKKRQDMSEAFIEIGRVMLDAPTPYLRLDSQDFIVDANLATCRLLLGSGINIADLQAIKRKTFSSFIDANDAVLYSEVQRKRRNNEDVGGYSLNLITPSGPLRVTVNSSRVPATGDEYGALPDTFGILLL